METPLSCMYLMPNTQTASNNQTNQILTEKWKGPWSQIRHVTDPKNSSIFGVKLLPGMARPAELSGGDEHWRAEFAAPVASTTEADIVWVIQDVKANEIVAGELGEVDITYVGVNKSGGDGDAFNNVKPTTWSLTWGSNQISPLAYCRNDTGGRASEIMECLKNPHPTVQEIKANMGVDVPLSATEYYYWRGTDDINKQIGVLVEDNQIHGQQIYDYMQREIKPMFHYPILERKQFIKQAPAVTSADYKNMSAKSLSALNNNDRVDYMTPEYEMDPTYHIIHHLGDIPEGCPYGGKFLSAYKWLCVEDNYLGKFNGSYHYERTTKWWGALDIDKNFYGPDGTRWKFPSSEPEVSAENNHQ